MALRLSPSAARGPTLTQTVRTLLERVRYREQAQRVRALLAGIDGAAGAATAIRRYLAQADAGARAAA
jgi:UDP:flavonoid glycosyltransferase YjiC (YdhE family)